MIARLEGLLFEKNPESIIIDVQGVGYQVRIPLSTYGALPSAGEPVQILVHTHVREDSLSLYGFSTALERHLFEKLISVSGVGPKLALALLSGLTVEELSHAILKGNTQLLNRVPGVGRKTAERLVVDLRDKLQPLAGAAGVGSDKEDLSGDTKGDGRLIADVRSALLNLGFSSRETDRALEEIRSGRGESPGAAEESFQDLFREALKRASAMR